MPVEVVTVERADVVEIGLQRPNVGKDAAFPYREVKLRPYINGELHEAPLDTVVNLVKETIEVESPIHQDEVITRIRSAWGLHRAGNRIEAHVGHAVRVAVNSGDILRSGDFLLWPAAPVSLRDRSNVASASIRRIEMIPPMEIDEGLKKVIEAGLGATEDEAVNAISRALGFKSTSSQLRDKIASRIAALVLDGALQVREGMLVARNAI